MRYSLYVYIKNMLDTLVEAMNYIKESDDKEIRSQLLINCKQVLESIENTLKVNEGYVRNKRIMREINSCNLQVSSIIHFNDQNLNFHEQIHRLSKCIQLLQNMYLSGIEVIYHVVFFAELGQKWDSMNSVYQAFKKRTDCDVKVVLTPIFRAANKNGKLETNVIYEDYLTPMGISHIPYKEYDISKELPDLAFISNPYESVTLPQFWPENISKYTRMIYLPYYAGMAINSESIHTHCGMPVAKFAWRIIAQSQKMKEIHKKYAPKQGANVLVTGLPKWDDHFLNEEISNEVSVNWDRKLRGKKVFLWNSHYDVNSITSTLLENGQSIVELFLNRKDLALVWRPHPMTETIFNMYLPHQLEWWNSLKEVVLEADNMILDTNTSYKMAFQYSDALISDWSSMLTQYMLTDKPILWLRKSIEAESALSKSEKFIRVDCLEQATSSDDIIEFVDRITRGIDRNKELRLRVKQEDMVGADGKIGERVCNLLVRELLKEDGMFNFNEELTDKMEASNEDNS